MFGLVAKGGSPDEQWAVFVQRQVLFPDAEGEVDQFQFVPLQPDLVGIAVASLAFALRRQAEDRPALWVSDLYGVQQGHADKWQVCLAHQLRNGQFAIEAGDMVFAPRMKAWLLRVCVLARRRGELAETTRRTCKRRFENDLDKIMDLSPENNTGSSPAKTIRQNSRQPSDLPRTSGNRPRQQQLRTRTPPHRYLPQSHRRLPLRLGRRPLRRHPLRRRHRRPPRPKRLRRYQINPWNLMRLCGKMSRYVSLQIDVHVLIGFALSV